MNKKKTDLRQDDEVNICVLKIYYTYTSIGSKLELVSFRRSAINSSQSLIFYNTQTSVDLSMDLSRDKQQVLMLRKMVSTYLDMHARTFTLYITHTYFSFMKTQTEQKTEHKNLFCTAHIWQSKHVYPKVFYRG